MVSRVQFVGGRPDGREPHAQPSLIAETESGLRGWGRSAGRGTALRRSGKCIFEIMFRGILSKFPKNGAAGDLVSA